MLPNFRKPATICLVVFVLMQLYLYSILIHPAGKSVKSTCQNMSSESNSIPQPSSSYEDSDIEAFKQNRHFYQRGNYTVLANYIEGSESFSYNETITFVTHASLGFLDNIETLIDFWSGPISVAVYAPGLDFPNALIQITFLRDCIRNGKAVKARVTFHILFDSIYLPVIENSENLYNLGLPKNMKCSSEFPNFTSYRMENKLLFPINIARNVAREGAQTFYVLVNDIELYPNPPDLIPKFFQMIRRMEQADPEFAHRLQVFVLPPFEVRHIVKIEEIPRNKSTLVQFLKSEQAFKFHKFACDICHRIPKKDFWANFTHPSTETANELNIFYTSSYISKFAWEPFYIGTHENPPFDERIHREHALNKVIQANALCHLGYKFHVLDNAFLVHKPGVKYGASFMSYYLKPIGKRIMRSQIHPLQKTLYGINEKCY